MNHAQETPTRLRAIQLRWDGPTVVVHPEDESRFVKEGAWAVSACQSKLAAERFVQQFTSEFLTSIRIWCQEHAKSVAACYVPLPTNSNLNVFVVTQSAQYDFGLSEAVAELEFSLFEKNWPSDINQIPAGSMEDLQTFFDPAASIQVYGNPG
ncbi:MAG TPA: hypothetical protein VMV69_04780 [Pirellulales bacterium]|nr:hypothetical protein [Pirellulales bacterium]